MRWARSATERRWWRLAGAYLGLIYLSLYPLQFVLDFLRAHNLLRLSMGAAFVAVGGAVVMWAARAGAGVRAWAALAAAGGVYVFLGAGMEIVQERAHLAEYGLLALLLRAALAARAAASAEAGRPRGRIGPTVGAWLLAAAAGWSDELIQWILPNRVYDLRDVAFNAGAAGLALAALAAFDAARAGDRRAREGAASPVRPAG